MVDDHSTDKTHKFATRAGAVVILNKYERKPHLAMLQGINSSRSQIVVALDADGQQPPRYIPRLLKPILEGDRTLLGRRIRLPPSEKPIHMALMEILGKTLPCQPREGCPYS